MKIRILECFAGIGAASKALENIGIDVQIVDAIEIDQYAIKSFNAVHGTFFPAQDITKYNKNLENIDLIMHGSPCQDFSVAGKQAGGEEGSGTRSSLVYESLRLIKKYKPKYVIWENVKNLLSVKHKPIFDAYIKRMTKLGYDNYYQVMNAEDYGIPQHRERVFTVSILKTLNQKFEFPPKQKLTKFLDDMLEDNSTVDEKYFLSDKLIKCFTNSSKEGGLFKKRAV